MRRAAAITLTTATDPAAAVDNDAVAAATMSLDRCTETVCGFNLSD